MLARRPVLAAPVLGATLGPMLGPVLGWTQRACAQALGKVHIGQATTSISYLPLQAARALGTFPAAGLDLYWAAIPGGDSACLAALDRGDIELAAVGAEALLSAVAKGRPFQIAASLMSKVPLELIASDAILQWTGIAPADPLAARLSVLKSATIGVSALGGTQDRAARWLAGQAGIIPRSVMEVPDAGPPALLLAALRSGKVDALVLTPPDGVLAEEAHTGHVLVRMGDEFPALKNLPALVLAIKTPVLPATRALVVDTCKALIAASTQLLADPAAAASVAEKLYPRMAPHTVAAAIESLKGGIAARGRLDPDGIAALVAYAGNAAAGLDAIKAPFWTNDYWDAAAP